MLFQEHEKMTEEELIPVRKSFLEELAYCPLNMIIDDLMLISEQQVPVINQKPIKRYYVNAKEIDEIFSIFSKVINSK